MVAMMESRSSPSPSIVQMLSDTKKDLYAEIAEFAGELKGIDGVAGKAADLTRNDQIEFSAFGIGKHFQ